MAATVTPAAGSHEEWLAYVQPTGLVVAAKVLDERVSAPTRQTAADTAAVRGVLDGAEEPRISDAWAFASTVLDWDAPRVAGAPGGPQLPELAKAPLPEHHATLRPDWVVLGDTSKPSEPSSWLLFVAVLDATIDLDKRGALNGWDATPSQQMERLLRETGAPAGLLIGGSAKATASSKPAPVLRLITAPRGETSGWMDFPVKALTEVAGRPLLAGIKLLFGKWGLYAAPPGQRLPDLIRESRAAQANVSTALAGQVLAALHSLLRGLHQAAPHTIEALASDPAKSHHLYEGLLTVLMRLVFLLYAEDRDLLPSTREGPALELYEANYSVRGLFAKLEDDQARFPATMDDRMGGWGRLLALFRLVYDGDRYGWIQPRGGKLFDPDVFPFLEGRGAVEAAPKVPRVSDACVLEVLANLMRLNGERLSYRTLDVEQIGSVYETVMGFTVLIAKGPALAIKAGKKDRTPVFVELEALLAQKPADRLKWLKENTDRGKFPPDIEAAIKAAMTTVDIAAAFEASKRGGVIDERGSPGKRIAPAGTPLLQPTDERRRTGSHYTPRSLTEPIVRHALEPAFERLGPDATAEQVLDLKVCDPAMGSGAFLVEACRQLGARLEVAWVRWPESKPVIPQDEDETLHARRLVAQKCLYGVDKNPMATDLARLSLWLATLARDHEFTFLDHALKSGDSLVGLTNRQIMSLSWAEGQANVELVAVHVRERLKEAEREREHIRTAPDYYKRADLEPYHARAEAKIAEVRLLGDAVVAAFFGADKHKARNEALSDVRAATLSGGDWRGMLSPNAAQLGLGSHPIRPFHWEIEFPEVFDRDPRGFDAIVGNPPFLGGTTIGAQLGSQFMDWLVAAFENTGDRVDLVGYFIRRTFALLRDGGSVGLIATNTVAQGDTREAALTYLCLRGAKISRAVKRYPWPGEAAVVVSQIGIDKNWSRHAELNGRSVETITPFLLATGPLRSPERLSGPNELAFEGMAPYASAFVLDAAAFSRFHASDAVVPYIGGKELNESPSTIPSEHIVYFRNWDLGKVTSDYSEIADEIRDPIIAERKGKSAARHPWWLYWRPRMALWSIIEKQRFILARSRHSTHHAVTKLDCPVVPDTGLVAFGFDSFSALAVLQSRLHELWALTFASTLEDRLRYTPSDVFETFPFPTDFEADPTLEAPGKACYDFRADLMVTANEGLTKTYNRFHDPDETRPAILELRRLHDAIDHAVLAAYGWSDLIDRARPVFEPLLAEDDEAETGRRAKKRFRYRWPEEVRDDVLARLLALNGERAAAERSAKGKVSPTEKAATRAKAAALSDPSWGLIPDHGPLFAERDES